MTMPRHIQDVLIANGVMTEQRVTRTPRVRRCAHCRATVIAAIDDLGFTATTDPEELTPYGELQAAMTGKKTWAKHHDSLSTRDAPFITSHPANTIVIHAEHKCGTSIPEHTPLNKTRTEYPDTPPF